MDILLQNTLYYKRGGGIFVRGKVSQIKTDTKLNCQPATYSKSMPTLFFNLNPFLGYFYTQDANFIKLKWAECIQTYNSYSYCTFIILCTYINTIIIITRMSVIFGLWMVKEYYKSLIFILWAFINLQEQNMYLHNIWITCHLTTF